MAVMVIGFLISNAVEICYAAREKIAFYGEELKNRK